MENSTRFLSMTPVLPSEDISRDIDWYKKMVGFELESGDEMYACLKRDNMHIHLQWHSGTKQDPVNGGSVIKIFVEDIGPVFQEFLLRGTVMEDDLRIETAWGTSEFGFYDLNKNAIYFVQDIE